MPNGDSGAPEDAALEGAAPEESAPNVAEPSVAGAAGAEAAEPLPPARLKRCLEAMLFASGEPISRKRLRRLLPEANSQEIEDALLGLERDLIATGRAFALVEEAAGLRFLTRSEFAPFIARLRGEKRPVRLSQAAFETLAVIAYRQPIRRADLEMIRGVGCGAILKNLMEWNLVRIVGRDESLGRPLLYGTSPTFLEQFGLKDLSALPAPERLQEFAIDHGVEVVSGDAARFGADSVPLFPDPAARADSGDSAP